MSVSQEIAGLKLGSKIRAPFPFDGDAEIIGFRYFTHHMSGRTCVVADFLFTNSDGQIAQSDAPIDKILRAQINDSAA